MDEIIIDDIFENKKKPFRFNTLTALIWSIILMLSLLMRSLHWPGSFFLFLVSTAGLSGYSYFGLVTTKGRNRLAFLYSLAATTWLIIIIYGLFRDGYPIIFVDAFIVYLIVLVIVFLIYYWIYRKSLHRQDENM